MRNEEKKNEGPSSRLYMQCAPLMSPRRHEKQWKYEFVYTENKEWTRLPLNYYDYQDYTRLFSVLIGDLLLRIRTSISSSVYDQLNNVLLHRKADLDICWTNVEMK